MTEVVSKPDLRRRSLDVEVQLALATPVARMLLVGSVVMAIAFCTANLAVLDDLSGDGPLQIAMHSATVPALVFALLAGAYSASADRRFGFIEQRLLSDQNRFRWLSSKAAAQAMVGVLYGLLGAITAIGASFATFSVRGEVFDIGHPDVRLALIGVVFAAPLLSVIGVSIGSLVSNTPMVVAGILVWSLVIEPPIILGLPIIGRWLPVAGALALTNSPDPELASQLGGGVSLAGYAALAVIISKRQLSRIDV